MELVVLKIQSFWIAKFRFDPLRKVKMRYFQAT
jgi:hypothetical protein